MRKFLIGVVAVAGVALATPALFQIYLGAGPVGVGIGVGPGPGYYDGYEGRRYRSYGYERGYARCIKAQSLTAAVAMGDICKAQQSNRSLAPSPPQA